MIRHGSLATACLGLLALAVAPPPAVAQTAAEVLARASDAMGAGALKSIRFAGEGAGWAYGQSYKPGMAWPKFTLHSAARTINYDTGAMRNEFVLSRAEPKGGGGYPLVGQ